MRGFKSRILILLIFTILILVVGCSEQKVNDTKSENECVVEENFIKSINLSGAIKSPEDVIRDSFKYENAHQLKNLLTCYTTRYKDINFRLDNLESCRLNSLELITDSRIYKSYFTSGRGMINNIKRENVRKYTVKYNVQYKDQSKEPEDSGEYEKLFTLIRENNLGEWKIDGIGES
ncbi:DUF4829 domain-containing protein [Clostridium botulinum]|nr:DUF4829 domain-containing protein [Clostridium botulinum]NFI18407.1 DUF4829 domain-containing protein [Clostridium botulinum]NFL92384.1 DUF4829 domain-containing protein [Clostridium botulinum]NFN51131.1 DUF4829 domain-containing protein [Clostridium botulinum]NFO26114.1 DUF4829 domain-containing protein [Clostridium botulinum]